VIGVKIVLAIKKLAMFLDHSRRQNHRMAPTFIVFMDRNGFKSCKILNFQHLESRFGRWVLSSITYKE